MRNRYRNISKFWEMKRWQWDTTAHFHVSIEEGYFECVEPEVDGWEPVSTGCIVVKPIMKCWGKGVTK